MVLKIDDGFLGHTKAANISERVLGFWLRGLLYAARNLTDGRLPKHFVRTKTQMALSDDLLRRGLWHKTADGYLIHDYLDWNDAKADVEVRRAAARQRQTEWRLRNAVTKALVTKQGTTDGINTATTTEGEREDVGTSALRQRQQEMEAWLR